tara:strand:- start:1733 stop:2800 length:1068 start_codon:yes stop_codon:yes gene_type:complete
MKLIKKLIFGVLFLYFCSINLYATEDTYIELKKIEKKLLSNEKTYKKLQKIEKDLNRDIKKIDYNNKKYEYLIKKSFDEKINLEKIINDNQLILKKENKSFLEYALIKRKLLEFIIVDSLLNEENIMISEIQASMYKKLLRLKENSRLEISSIQKNLISSEIELKKINSTLSQIRNKAKKNSSKIEGFVGESIVTAVQKEEKKLEKKYIKKRALKLKNLIESLEKNKRNKTSYFHAKIKNLLPVGQLSIENIRTDRLKTGILLTLKNDSLIKAPQNGLVVYADVFKGYGKMVILDLGDNYHLIFSGLSDILCKRGEWIEKGGILGDMGINLNDNDLYMEVRFKGKTISPKNWASS